MLPPSAAPFRRRFIVADRSRGDVHPGASPGIRTTACGPPAVRQEVGGEHDRLLATGAAAALQRPARRASRLSCCWRVRGSRADPADRLHRRYQSDDDRRAVRRCSPRRRALGGLQVAPALLLRRIGSEVAGCRTARPVVWALGRQLPRRPDPPLLLGTLGRQRGSGGARRNRRRAGRRCRPSRATSAAAGSDRRTYLRDINQ
jgi:hypothetical protein